MIMVTVVMTLLLFLTERVALLVAVAGETTMLLAAAFVL
jgi:hypothetical protein